jgi:hypothetical protein
VKTVVFEAFKKFIYLSASLKGETVTPAFLKAIFVEKNASAKSGREGKIFLGSSQVYIISNQISTTR